MLIRGAAVRMMQIHINSCIKIFNLYDHSSFA